MTSGLVWAPAATCHRPRREGSVVALQEPPADRGLRLRRLPSVSDVRNPDRDTQQDAAADGADAVERQVAAGLVAGDRAALETAFRSWGGLVHGYVRQAVGADAADDLTQQVFVEAWRARDRFDPDRGVVPAWLVGIARNLVSRHWRTAHRTPTPVDVVEDTEPSPDHVAGIQTRCRAWCHALPHLRTGVAPRRRRVRRGWMRRDYASPSCRSCRIV